jgi:hypothetical protein
MAMFNDQLKQVLRRLIRAPLFTAITLITLAVGVGANTVIFSVVEGILLKPLPYPHAEQLIGVWHTAPGIGLTELNISPSIYFIDREQNTTLQDIGAYSGDSLDVTGAGKPEHVPGLDVTDGALPILGAAPVLGRRFTRRDDSAGAPTDIGSGSLAAHLLSSGAPSPWAENQEKLSACCPRDSTFSINRTPRSSCLTNGIAITPSWATSVSAPSPA